MCQFWNKEVSKRFVEIMYSIEAVKIEVSFSSLNEWSPWRSFFEAFLESSLLKIFVLILWSLLKNVSLSFEKSGQWRNISLIYL